MSELVIRLRAAGTRIDGYGDTLPDWTLTPLRKGLTAYGVEPVSASEDNDGRQAVITGLRIYFRNEWPDVLALDRMTVRGTTWEVDGQPADWRGTGLGGMVVALKQTVG